MPNEYKGHHMPDPGNTNPEGENPGRPPSASRSAPQPPAAYRPLLRTRLQPAATPRPRASREPAVPRSADLRRLRFEDAAALRAASVEHSCFRPRPQDCKPPVTCDGDNDAALPEKGSPPADSGRAKPFLNAFTQINAMNALGPLVDIHANAVHQMHGNPRFLPWHRIYLLRMEDLLMMVDPTVCIPTGSRARNRHFRRGCWGSRQP